jgi:hypothetical protein
MRILCVCIAVTLAGLVFGSEPDAERARRQLKSDNYTVTWGAARSFDAKAELEIGHGNGHGGTLGWLRFRPTRDGVDVLSIKFDEGLHQYKSKWPPDRSPVTVKFARLKSDEYVVLLHDLAIIDAAKLKVMDRDSSWMSSNDFWVNEHLSAAKTTLIDQNWAVYNSIRNELNFAKPKAAVALARDAIKSLEFKEHVLTDEERGWASAKFARDWKKFKSSDFHWWVRERYIMMIGVVGDKTALATLRDVLSGDPKDRCVYHTINAITRLTKKDVRDKPVEEMDVEKTRRKVLELLPSGK